MKRTKEQRLTKFWENNINPITGWFEDKRMHERKKSKKAKL
tara:strand:+ start:1191 stop:1313 length:123 start_codon:yes stop_codon:yes gene_type:complete